MLTFADLWIYTRVEVGNGWINFYVLHILKTFGKLPKNQAQNFLEDFYRVLLWVTVNSVALVEAIVFWPIVVNFKSLELHWLKQFVKRQLN